MNHCPQMPLSGQRHIKGIYQREDVQNEATKVNAFVTLCLYSQHSPPTPLGDTFPLGKLQMLAHEWHPTALLRMVLLSFPQHPRLMVGKRSPHVPFSTIFIYVRQSKRMIQNLILTCAVPLCRSTGIRLQRRTYKDYTLATLSLPPHRHGCGQGVETSLVCRRVARKIINIYLFLSPSRRRTPLSAIILCSLSHLPRCSRHT